MDVVRSRNVMSFNTFEWESSEALDRSDASRPASASRRRRDRSFPGRDEEASSGFLSASGRCIVGERRFFTPLANTHGVPTIAAGRRAQHCTRERNARE
jgi:hypothetical protein